MQDVLGENRREWSKYEKRIRSIIRKYKLVYSKVPSGDIKNPHFKITNPFNGESAVFDPKRSNEFVVCKTLKLRRIKK